MHRADDPDVLDLLRAFMSLDVTLILTGVNIPGIGLLREAKWNKKTRQWEMPPLESTRIHGLEITQTEHRFELIELDRFRYTTLKQIQAFINHLKGIEQHLRLLNTKEGMLTGGTMPEYLMRRTGGVVGLLERLLEDGAQAGGTRRPGTGPAVLAVVSLLPSVIFRGGRRLRRRLSG